MKQPFKKMNQPFVKGLAYSGLTYAEICLEKEAYVFGFCCFGICKRDFAAAGAAGGGQVQDYATEIASNGCQINKL